MPFRPAVSESITINRKTYTFTEHPSAKKMPYGQTGRRATVYQLKDRSGDLHALKVFTKLFRSSNNEYNAARAKKYAALPGLEVCERNVLTAKNHSSLLRKYPDLYYSVLMPWADGQTWQEIILSQQSMTREQCLSIALNLSITLSEMERVGIAHCDLSGGNILVNGLNILLVDVEDLYGKGLKPPNKLPAGSAGYAHSTAQEGLWRADADRFAATILFAEMMCWHDPQVRRGAFGEQYFDAVEIGKSCDRYRLMVKTLKKISKDAAELFSQAWHSKKISHCPSLKEWYKILSRVTSSIRHKEVTPIIIPEIEMVAVVPPTLKRKVKLSPVRQKKNTQAPKRNKTSYKATKKMRIKRISNVQYRISSDIGIWLSFLFIMVLVFIITIMISGM